MASDETSKPKRRIVKKVETIREKAAKSEAKPKNKGVLSLTWRYISWPFRMIGKGIAKVGRFVIPRYFKDSWRELRQVTWPSRRDTLKLTLAVIIFSVVFGVMITVVDIILDKVFRKVILS